MILALFISLFLASSAWAIPSPNDPFREVSMHRAAGATADGTPISVDYFTLATIEVTITGTATITWEHTITGINWNTGACVNANAPGTLVTTATASGLYYCNIASLTQFRGRISTFSTGTVTSMARLSQRSFKEFFSPSSTGGSGGGAPTDANYWVGGASASLSSEVDLSALSTGLLLNASGVPSAYVGTTCTNQVVRLLSAAGVATCATITSAYVDSSVAATAAMYSAMSLGF